MKTSILIIFVLSAVILLGCSGVQTIAPGEFVAIAQGPSPGGEQLTHRMLRDKAHKLARTKCPDYQVIEEGMYIYLGLGYEIIFSCP